MSKKKAKQIEIIETSCRICLKACADQDADCAKFAEKYTFCTGYLMQDYDIPKKICKTCISGLKKVSSFQNKCKKTELHLQQYSPSLEPEVNIATPDIKLETPETEQVMIKLEVESYDYNVENEIPVVQQPKTKLLKSRICDQCGLVFNDRSIFKAHYKQHFQDDPNLKMYCDLCLQKTHQKIGFFTKERLRIHMVKHHLKEKKPKPCPHCGRLFTNGNTFQSHIFRKHVDPKDYKYECMVCNRRFYNNHLLKTHHRSHTGEKMYSCHICGAKFSMPQHMRTHVENIHHPTIHNCESCGKTFTSLKYLKQHMKTHDQAGYTCPLCPGKTFSLTTTLRSHITTNHPTFPLPPPGTMLKNFNWGQRLETAPTLSQSGIGFS